MTSAGVPGTVRWWMPGLLTAVLAWFPPPAMAALLEEENLEIHGALLGNFSHRSGAAMIGEERLRLDLAAWSESFEGGGHLKAEFFHDAVNGGLHGEVREGYLDYTTGPFDFRLGRQVATWGVGDMLFINDVFPKDWVSFFSGRPLEYLKVGVDGLRARHSSSSLNTELLIIPFFQEEIMPAEGRFAFTSPVAPAAMHNGEDPAATVENTEVALRLYRRMADFDVSVHAYRGFWRSGTFPELSVYGVSGQGNSLGGVVSLEAGYYHSRNDEDGDNPSIPNSQFRFLTGYQRQLADDFTVGVQYYAEIMENHSTYVHAAPSGSPVQDRYRDTMTLRLEKLLMHETWKLSWFMFHGLAEDDYLLQPKITYRFSDQLSATLGGNVFGGTDDTTFLGQFYGNDNVYLNLRHDF